MKLRSALRAAAVLAGVAGLAGVLVPPASAEGTKTVVFVGTATVTGGLGYPCTNTTPPTVTLPDEPTKGTKTCPPQTRVNPGANKKQKLVDVNGDTRTGTFTSQTGVCVATGVTVGKGNKAPANAGTCVITSAFTVTGYCGLSQGVGSATITVANTTPPNQIYNADYTWFSSGTLLTLRGQAWTGTKPATPDWYLTGTVSAAPNLLVAGTSCTNKTGQVFNIEGAVDIVHPNPSTLP